MRVLPTRSHPFLCHCFPYFCFLQFQLRRCLCPARSFASVFFQVTEFRFYSLLYGVHPLRATHATFSSLRFDAHSSSFVPRVLQPPPSFVLIFLLILIFHSFPFPSFFLSWRDCTSIFFVYTFLVLVIYFARVLLSHFYARHLPCFPLVLLPERFSILGRCILSLLNTHFLASFPILSHFISSFGSRHLSRPCFPVSRKSHEDFLFRYLFVNSVKYFCFTLSLPPSTFKSFVFRALFFSLFCEKLRRQHNGRKME